MKRILFAAALVLLAGCGDQKEEAKPKAAAPKTLELSGAAQYASGETITAKVEKKGDAITSIELNTTATDGTPVTDISQMSDRHTWNSTLGIGYGKQMDSLEAWMLQNGPNISFDANGRPTDPSLLSQVDVNVIPAVNAVQNALAAQKK